MKSIALQSFNTYCLGETLVRYVVRSDHQHLPGLQILPASMAEMIVEPRPYLDDPCVSQLPPIWGKMPAFDIEPLVQFKLAGTAFRGGFGNGRTLRGADEVFATQLIDHGLLTTQTGSVITTRLQHEASGLIFTHTVSHNNGKAVLHIFTSVSNQGREPVTLDLLSSFTLAGLSPFTSHHHVGHILLHRFPSAWSAEARPLVQSLEELHLEPSWTGHACRELKFGVTGSMPNNDWFPVIGVEDLEVGVVWAAQLVVPGSWQFEVVRDNDYLALGGGLRDAESGAWRKTLRPGESFSAPEAWLTCAKATAEQTWPRLFDGYPARDLPPSENELPVVFNEWCHSWGNPKHETIMTLADRLQGSGIRYFVIDDGWAERPGEAALQSNGDWILKDSAFPGGLSKTVEMLAEHGLLTGLWFEFEVCNPGSKAWEEEAHHLKREGKVLQVGSRRFWDFRDAWVFDYLSEKVIGQLKESGIRYLKVDYNDSIGLGCDGAESLGEGLQRHLDGVLRFFEKIRQEIPDIVIENCSSGGFREVAPFIACTDMCSFSDAHETSAIPIIAANLLPLVPSHKLQIWAVLRQEDDARRLYYSLAATFLGRMCLSGTIETLEPWQWETTLNAISKHREHSELLLASTTERLSNFGPSYNHPTGWQGVWRHGESTSTLVLHTFGNAPESIGPIPCGQKMLRNILSAPFDQIRQTKDGIVWESPGDFAGAVLFFDYKHAGESEETPTIRPPASS